MVSKFFINAIYGTTPFSEPKLCASEWHLKVNCRLKGNFMKNLGQFEELPNFYPAIHLQVHDLAPYLNG